MLLGFGKERDDVAGDINNAKPRVNKTTTTIKRPVITTSETNTSDVLTAKDKAMSLEQACTKSLVLVPVSDVVANNVGRPSATGASNQVSAQARRCRVLIATMR
jgi:hypothetical protein